MNEDTENSARAARKAASRAKILFAAKALFLARGYEGATVRDIAKAAKVSAGLLFSHFPDKQHILQHLLLEDIDAILRENRGCFSPDRSSADALGQIAEILLTYYAQHVELSRVLVASMLFRADCYGGQLQSFTHLLQTSLARELPGMTADDRKLIAEVMVSHYLFCVVDFLAQENASPSAYADRLRKSCQLIVRKEAST